MPIIIRRLKCCSLGSFRSVAVVNANNAVIKVLINSQIRAEAAGWRGKERQKENRNVKTKERRERNDRIKWTKAKNETTFLCTHISAPAIPFSSPCSLRFPFASTPSTFGISSAFPRISPFNKFLFTSRTNFVSFPSSGSVCASLNLAKNFRFKWTRRRALEWLS